MPDYSDLIPANLKPGLTTPDGANLKPGLVTPAYTGGTPSAADQIKPSLRNADGSLKAGLVLGSELKPSLVGSGGDVLPAIELLASRVEGLGTDGGTSTPINTLTAKLIVVGISFYNNAAITLTDSEGNTWISMGVINESPACIATYYCLNPNVSAAHTVTFTGSTQLSSIAFAAFANVTAFDHFNRGA